ncbi:MAG: hypothetical protein IJZ98_01705 [Bacteroidales bacterium]|nr:hypothetical protein [Bacteroidales bacterium]
MKKALYYISIAATLAAACSQLEEKIQEPASGEPITAHIDIPTRTSMGPNEDGIYKVNWSEGDQIVVSNGNLEAIYQAAESGSSSAVFIPMSRIMLDFSNGVIAAYPTAEMYLGNPDADEEIYLNIPTNQTYVAGSFADETMPMISDVAYEPVLNFKNAAGVLKFNISCASETVKVASITVTTAEAISGECCYVPGEGTYYPDTSLLSENFVNLNCPDGVDVGSEAVPFHVVVPNQTYTEMNITITATDGRQHIFRMKADKDITVARAAVLTIPLKIDRFGEMKKPEVSLSVSSVSFTSFSIKVNMKNVSAYYCGLESKESFQRGYEDGSMLEGLEWKTAYTTPMSYSGAVSRFQEECKDILIEPGHEYVFWIVPQSPFGEYSQSDVTYVEAKTKNYTAGGNVTLSTDDCTVGMTEISMDLTASSSVTIIYNLLLSENQLKAYPTEQDRIDLLLSGNAYFIEKISDLVVYKFLSPGTKYTMLALAVNNSGQYGPLYTQEFVTEEIPYNSLTVNIDKDIDRLREDQTLRWTVTGGEAVQYRYIFTAKDRHLWTGTLDSSVDKADEVMALNSGLYYISKTTATEAKVSLESGKEYILIITATDETGNTALSSHWEFTY